MVLENLANYLILHRCVTVGKNDADKSMLTIAKDKINNWLVNIRTRKWRPSIADAFDAKRPAALLLEDSVCIFEMKEKEQRKIELRPIKGWDASKVPSEYSEPLKKWAPKKGAAKKKKEAAKVSKKAKAAKGGGAGGDKKKPKKPAGEKKKPKSKKPAGGKKKPTAKGGETPLDLLSSVAELSVVLSEATMPPVPDISPIAYNFGTSPIGTDGMMTEI